MDQLEKIIWTDRGIESLESIADYIALDSQYYASRFVKRIIQRIEMLKNFPMMGRIVPEFNRPNLRELIIQNYRIVYTVEENIVYIVLVSHSFQLLPEDLNGL